MPIFIFIFFLSLSFPVIAGDIYGLTMHGLPKYNISDTHLSYSNPQAPKGGTLKQSAIGTFDTLNPFSIKGKAPQGINLINDRLMARVWDEPFSLYPLIAEKIDIPEDRSGITFYLNPKAKFHDGSPIRASDVLFSFETLRDHGRPNQRRIYKLAQSSNILDEQTIKFVFKEGYDRETVMIFAMMPILSKAYWQDRSFDETTLDIPLNNGPYKIKEVDPGKRITFERVKDYWAQDLLTNRGHHNFDYIIYDYYRDDTVAFEAFKSGSLDLRREWDAGTWHSAYGDITNKKETINLEALPHGRPDRVRGFIFNTRRPIFQDKNVREALSLLFDFDWVNKNLFYNAYQQIDSFYPNTDLAATTGNTEKTDLRTRMRQADQLLKQAGWIIKDGKRVHQETGKNFDFEILLDNPNNEKLALSLIKNLQRMGISAQVRVLDSAAFRGRLHIYDFDMTLYYWLSTLSPGTEQYLYWSCEAAKLEGRWNYAGICDPEIDTLAQNIAHTYDRKSLIESVQALDRKLMDGHYMIPLYYNPKDYIAYWNRIERPSTTPLYGMVLETWWEKGTL